MLLDLSERAQIFCCSRSEKLKRKNWMSSLLQKEQLELHVAVEEVVAARSRESLSES